MNTRFNEASTKHFLQMDVLSINFQIFRNGIGELQIDM